MYFLGLLLIALGILLVGLLVWLLLCDDKGDDDDDTPSGGAWTRSDLAQLQTQQQNLLIITTIL